MTVPGRAALRRRARRRRRAPTPTPRSTPRSPTSPGRAGPRCRRSSPQRRRHVVELQVRWQFTGRPVVGRPRRHRPRSAHVGADESIHDLAARTVTFAMVADHYADRFSVPGHLPVRRRVGDGAPRRQRGRPAGQGAAGRQHRREGDRRRASRSSSAAEVPIVERVPRGLTAGRRGATTDHGSFARSCFLDRRRGGRATTAGRIRTPTTEDGEIDLADPDADIDDDLVALHATGSPPPRRPRPARAGGGRPARFGLDGRPARTMRELQRELGLPRAELRTALGDGLAKVRTAPRLTRRAQPPSTRAARLTLVEQLGHRSKSTVTKRPSASAQSVAGVELPGADASCGRRPGRWCPRAGARCAAASACGSAR